MKKMDFMLAMGIAWASSDRIYNKSSCSSGQANISLVICIQCLNLSTFKMFPAVWSTQSQQWLTKP